MKKKKEITPEEKMKLEIAQELGYLERVEKDGWKSLSASETGKIGGIMSARRKMKKH